MQENFWEKDRDSGTKLLRRELFLMWWQASRPATFMATLVPLTLAFVAAGKYKGIWGGLVFAGALLVALALHMSASLCFHLFDDGDGGKIREHSRPHLKEIFTSKFILKIVAGLCAFALLLTFVAVLITGRSPLLFFALFAIFSSVFHVAPPLGLCRHGMGEILVFLNLGFIAVCGTFYALTGDFPLYTLALAIPAGFMVAMVIFYRSIIGLRKDILAGRKSLAIFLGPEKSVFLYTMAWPVIWLLLVMLWFCGFCSWQVVFGIIFALPFYVKLSSDLKESDDPESGQGLSACFACLISLVCGIGLIVAVAYTAPPQKHVGEIPVQTEILPAGTLAE